MHMDKRKVFWGDTVPTCSLGIHRLYCMEVELQKRELSNAFTFGYNGNEQWTKPTWPQRIAAHRQLQI